MSNFEFSLSYAQAQDEQDVLKQFRSQFLFPQHHGKEVIYLTGNSLGLQPVTVRAAVEQELTDWATYGVEGHFHAKNPWFHYHKFLTEKAARVVGAKPVEVVVMNNLTVNLHLMMVSFYRPTAQRYKIIMEGGAFPSDQYAMETQARFHGLDPEKTIVELLPREGEYTLRTEDILAAIQQHGNELALVMMGGVNYYTGQAYDMQAITKAAHEAGAYAGFDLAHAAGNLHLQLHDWDVDFAVWCSYKYLNSGPGGTSGAFVHERHADNKELIRFAGWWGHNEEERFLMKKGFNPMLGAQGWQLSNAQVFPMAIHKASLDIFDEAGMKQLRDKSVQLTGYLEFVLDEVNAGLEEHEQLKIITPRDVNQRGAQLSVVAGERGRALFKFLTENGVVADWREPDVIRMAPAPLYNSFTDVYHLGVLLHKFFVS
ncbi:MAG TPA: kynureninase [Bacteroidia bacterium]|nr:kynureninase [Bacteroidia bacterium]